MDSTTDLREVFGTNVRHHRRSLVWTQEHLAERGGATYETIGKIERGAAAPSFDTASRIAVELKVDPSTLFGAIAVVEGARGKLLSQIQKSLARMNEEQLARASKMLDAFIGR
ncbi:helix-turn-helix transcriptional regulator [Ruegeria sp. ANG-R]|uniref:helix-turn-helix domain-containing protein n=1 Tax=Ruegeria sp. ANG-R TaxID=1577903 RepID=UPI0006906236|nr:helix-turn-helix transcriptional regulator [Ruegeria sp. ANG-R]